MKFDLGDLSRLAAKLDGPDVEYDKQVLPMLLPVIKEVIPGYRPRIQADQRFTTSVERALSLMPPGDEFRFILSKTFARGKNDLAYSAIVFRFSDDLEQTSGRSWGRTPAIAILSAILGAWWILDRERAAEMENRTHEHHALLRDVDKAIASLEGRAS